MTCAHCRDAPEFFSRRTARRDLRRYRRRGPLKSSRMLIDALKERAGAGGSLLDIGGGIGAVQHELLEAGTVERVVNVDASPAFQEAAVEEARRHGRDEAIELYLGDFVEIAPSLGEADIVTLDRVICCYPDMPALVGASAERARHLYGVVIPREKWWVRIGLAAANVLQRLRRSDFRVFLHPTPAILAEIHRAGLRQVHSERTFVWQVMVFERRED